MKFFVLTTLVGIVAMTGSAPRAYALGDFDGVTFLSAMVRDNQISDASAMELSDALVLFRLRTVGQDVKASHEISVEKWIEEIDAFWGGSFILRIPYAPEVVSWDGEPQFKLGAIEDPENNLYDHANEEMQQLAAEAMGRTFATMTNEWVMFDEPLWGYRGMENAYELPISDALSKAVNKRVGRPIESVEAFNDDPELWHAFVYERQRALARSLGLFSDAARSEGKKVIINLFPATMESGAVTGFEIATAMDVFGDRIDQISIDPYYTLFVEDPRYAGFMLRLVDDSTPRDLTMLGWIDGVNGLLEELALKNPPPESMKPQIATYLANGSDSLAVWAYSYLVSMGNLEAFTSMTRWVRESQSLYRGNPEFLSDTGLYYSNLTVAMNDYFPVAWSHGTGPFGQYFTALQTYYMTTVIQVPVRVLSTPLGHEDRLEAKLAGLRRLIVADALVMSDDEVAAIDAWVHEGGELIVIGNAGEFDELKNLREGGLSSISGIRTTAVKPRESLIFTDEWPAAERAESIQIDGSNEHLLIERYLSNREYALNPEHTEKARYFPERWPLHLRDSPLKPTRKLEEPHPSDWQVVGAAGLDVGDAKVLARFDDGEPAIAVSNVGQGKVIHIAPTDWLTRYRDPVARRAAWSLFHEVSESQFELSGADEADRASIELVVNERVSGSRRGIMVHLIRHVHDDQAIPPRSGELEDIRFEMDLGVGEQVDFVTGFSPDGMSSAEVSYNQEGQNLEIRFDALDVYSAVIVGVSLTEDIDSLEKGKSHE